MRAADGGTSNNIGLLPDHSGGGEVILSFTSPALQKYNCMLDSSVVGRRSPPLSSSLAKSYHLQSL